LRFRGPLLEEVLGAVRGARALVLLDEVLDLGLGLVLLERPDQVLQALEGLGRVEFLLERFVPLDLAEALLGTGANLRGPEFLREALENQDRPLDVLGLDELLRLRGQQLAVVGDRRLETGRLGLPVNCCSTPPC
jgi:hypothetical protein